MNLDYLIDRADEQKRKADLYREAQKAIADAERVLAIADPKSFEMDNASLTRVVVELARRVVALEGRPNPVTYEDYEARDGDSAA